jgi:hypothetical protein
MIGEDTAGQGEADTCDEAAYVFDAGERRHGREKGVSGFLACDQPALFPPHHPAIGYYPSLMTVGDGRILEGGKAFDFLKFRFKGCEGTEHGGLRWCGWLVVSGQGSGIRDQRSGIRDQTEGCFGIQD